jgi:hypothetical protein
MHIAAVTVGAAAMDMDARPTVAAFAATPAGLLTAIPAAGMGTEAARFTRSAAAAMGAVLAAAATQAALVEVTAASVAAAMVVAATDNPGSLRL